MCATNAFIGREGCEVGTVSFKNESNGDAPTKTVLTAVMIATSTEFKG